MKKEKTSSLDDPDSDGETLLVAEDDTRPGDSGVEEQETVVPAIR